MNKAHIYIVLLYLALCSACGLKKAPLSDDPLFSTGTWQSEKISSTVTYSQYYSENLFGAKQRLHVIRIKPSGKLNLDIVWSPDSLKKTSTFAKSADADFAINGSFFHPKEGGPVCFLKVDGKIVQQTRTELGDDYFIPGLDSGALVQHSNKWELLTMPANGWTSMQSVPTIISGGPVLVEDNQIVTHIRHSFHQNRFSRTAVGTTSSDELVFLVADGNSETSAGLSIDELAQVMKSLNCTSALNMDGGGSSTMYIKGKSGIVNQPTDHKYFDYRGERGVATVIIGRGR